MIDWLFYLYIKKKAKWGEEIVCCCRNVKVTFLALFLGWCHSGECAKGHDFPEGADILFIEGCLWALLPSLKSGQNQVSPFSAMFGSIKSGPLWNKSPKSLLVTVPSHSHFLYLLTILFRGLLAAWPLFRLLVRLIFPCCVKALRPARGVCVFKGRPWADFWGRSQCSRWCVGLGLETNCFHSLLPPKWSQSKMGL